MPEWKIVDAVDNFITQLRSGRATIRPLYLCPRLLCIARRTLTLVKPQSRTITIIPGSTSYARPLARRLMCACLPESIDFVSIISIYRMLEHLTMTHPGDITLNRSSECSSIDIEIIHTTLPPFTLEGMCLLAAGMQALVGPGRRFSRRMLDTWITWFRTYDLGRISKDFNIQDKDKRWKSQ